MKKALRWMADTNILSELIRNPQGPLVQHMLTIDMSGFCTSIVVACEMRYGAQRRGSAALQAKVEELLNSLPVLPLDADADKHYADIRTELEAAGTPIGSHDLFIAAHARASGLTLVTRNTREFTRVRALLVEDWMAARS